MNCLEVVSTNHIHVFKVSGLPKFVRFPINHFPYDSTRIPFIVFSFSVFMYSGNIDFQSKCVSNKKKVADSNGIS